MFETCQAFVFFALLPLNIIINEVAWMGTKTSPNNEWIELYNHTSSPINLDGWILKAADGTPKIQLAGSILANGFYLAERSKDYTGALHNQGERLELFDNLGNLIDSADADSGWPAGDNASKQTMERKNNGGWRTSQNPGGTPNAQNSEAAKTTKNGSLSNLTETKLDSVEENSGWQSLAAVSEPASQKGSAFFIVALAACLAVFSGMIILVLKKGSK